MTKSDDKNEFFPKGALAFFVSMIVFYAALWFGLYFLMLARK